MPDVKAAVLLIALASVACQRVPGSTNAAVDPDLAAEISTIKAIDNHAHPVRPVAPGEAPDTFYDALPVEHLEPESEPVRTRDGSPELLQAQRALFGGAKATAQRTLGEKYATRVLDQLGIDIMLANRVAMGPGLPSNRFLWVPYADALMYPFPTEPLIHNPDQKAFFALEQKLLDRYYSECGVTSRPATLDEYLAKVVDATIERQKQGGAVAEKFEMAYLRPLNIGNPAKEQAEASWRDLNARLGAGSSASAAQKAPQKGTAKEGGEEVEKEVQKETSDYKTVQDYIFHHIAAESGRLGMAVHFHSDAGAGSYFNVAGGNPMLLEPLFDDPSLRHTNFVMLHGGWPFEHQLTALLTKPNVYVDFSSQTYLLYPSEVAQTLREWLEYVPEKVLFATDAYPYSAQAGWEETGYIAATTGREALGIALTGMMRDGEITRTRASELARMVLRDNARALYKLK
jgi:uncharacterized protein